MKSHYVVGYASNNAGDYLHKTWGSCFVSLNASQPGMFRLGDIKLTGSTWGDDWICFLDPATSIQDMSKNVTYYSAEEAGDPDLAEWEDGDEKCKDDVEYPFGTGFICNFLSKGVTMTYAGQVNADSAYSTIDCTGKPNATICNMYPADLTFGQIKLENSVWGDDWVCFLDPASSVQDMSRNITYYSEAEAGNPDLAEWEDGEEHPMDHIPLKMGEAFICNFLSSNVKVIFPTYKAAE